MDGSRLEIFKIVIAFLPVENKVRRPCFFEKTFIFANINISMALGMFFRTLRELEVHFAKQEHN